MAYEERDTPLHKIRRRGKDRADSETSIGALACQDDGSVILKLRSDHRKRSEAPLAEVQVHERETLESALRRFKRQVLQEDIIKEIKRHSFYLKPGERKRVKAALARKRDRKKRRRESAGEPIHLRDSRV
jgi:small subunit ribosomal protein S21